MFITHDMSVVKHISTEIAVMYMGQCVEYANKNELFANPLHPYTRALLSAIPVIDFSRANGEPELLKGEVSSPVNPNSYCRFYPRCKFAQNSCRESKYDLTEIENGHFCACHLVKEGGL